MSKKTETAEVTIVQMSRGSARFHLLGDTPLILNRMSEKAQRQLLLPPKRKNTAERETTLKHQPYEEFRASPYLLTNDEAPTYLAHLSTAFKQALANAALDMPGAKKAQIGRLVWVASERVPIFGVPKLFMAVTRSADMNKTPDVRTRCIVPRWACEIEVQYSIPLITEKQVTQLLAAAGLIQGVGDWRPQKGSGTFGQFHIVSDEADHAEFRARVSTGGREAQIEAMDEALPYDDETAELLAWFDVECKRRDIKGVA